MAKIFKFIFLLFAFICVRQFCHQMTAGFAVSKILSHADLEHASIQIPPEDLSHVSRLLDQPFYFYKKGGQCFVFMSEDKKTVIKFFKHHNMRFWHWLSKISFPGSLDRFRIKLLNKHRHQTYPYFFHSCELAYEKFQEQTGLIYLQFARAPWIQQKLILYDKLNIAHTISLSDTDFVVQRRAQSVHKKFKKLIREKNIKLCEQYIDSMLNLIAERCRQGIEDRDFNVRSNFGLFEGKVIEIDIGSYHDNPSLKEPQAIKIELRKQTEKFKKWLQKHDQTLANYLAERIDSV